MGGPLNGMKSFGYYPKISVTKNPDPQKQQQRSIVTRPVGRLLFARYT